MEIVCIDKLKPLINVINPLWYLVCIKLRMAWQNALLAVTPFLKDPKNINTKNDIINGE